VFWGEFLVEAAVDIGLSKGRKLSSGEEILLALDYTTDGIAVISHRHVHFMLAQVDDVALSQNTYDVDEITHQLFRYNGKLCRSTLDRSCLG
jgi:hypothetical protein